MKGRSCNWSGLSDWPEKIMVMTAGDVNSLTKMSAGFGGSMQRKPLIDFNLRGDARRGRSRPAPFAPGHIQPGRYSFVMN
jgi:hypothetical protein